MTTTTIKEEVLRLHDIISNCEYAVLLTDITLNHCNKIKSNTFIKVASELKFACDRIQKDKFVYYFRNYLGYNLSDLEHVMMAKKNFQELSMEILKYKQVLEQELKELNKEVIYKKLQLLD